LSKHNILGPSVVSSDNDYSKVVFKLIQNSYLRAIIPYKFINPSFSLLPFQALPVLSDSYNLHWVYSDIHLSQIEFLDRLTPS